MSRIARFAAYAAAFEQAFEGDDWSILEPYFSEDAVYEIGLPILGAERCNGRAEILAWFPTVLDRFDRRFASRTLALLEGPRETKDEVWIRGAATYRASGVPDFVLELEEAVRFDGERIVHLQDRYSEVMRDEVEAYLRAHGARLGIVLPGLERMIDDLDRRGFLRLAAGAAGLALVGCGSDDERYTAADRAGLARQREVEAARKGRGPFGRHVYRGYRGLAELPWFELDEKGVLRCVADDFPPAIDLHCHFGISTLFAPEIDLLARAPRVKHLLDCDGSDPGCELDLDIYINGNFSKDQLNQLWWGTIAQGTWGSSAAATQTIPNLLDEMDATRVGQAMILPIAFGFPLGDDLTERWSAAIRESGTSDRLIAGASVHPHDSARIAKLERYAKAGARLIKLHPTMQRFYPDEPDLMEIYAACERLGLRVFFHGGRAGIEPESTHGYAMPRHYEAALSSFPKVQFVLGHAGARDGEAMLDIGMRYENAWFDIHGQSVTQLGELLRRTGGERLLFGTDWPFYHLAASLAKVLIVTEKQPAQRAALLRGNAERLLAV